MLTVRLYFDATVAVAIMAILGITSGFIAAGLTGDPTLTLAAAGAVFILTGTVLIVYLWRTAQKSPSPLDPGI